MRSLVESVRKDVTQFVEQRDDFILLAECSTTDTASFLAVLRNVEQSLGSDLFLLFADDFIQPGPFASVAVERLAEEVRIANEALLEEGREPFPQLPKAVRDEARPPAERLRDAIAFARSLVPPDEGHRLVWAMCPNQIKDRAAYRALISALVPSNGIQPWMTGARLVFRDDAAEPSVALSKSPRVRRMKVDFGPDAMERSLREDVENEAQPEEQRTQSLLSLALLDYAHSHYPEAMDKYTYLLGYYQKTKDLAMQAFVLNCTGDIYRRQGDLENAQDWYERAAVPACEAKQPVILATVVKNLGDVSFEQKNYGEAEQYYTNLDKLAAHLLDPEGKVRALERRGLCQEKLGAVGIAIESWEGAATLCRNIGLPALLKTVLEHLERGYRRLNAGDKLRAVQAELREVARSGEAS